MKNTMTTWTDVTMRSLEHFWSSVASQTPRIIGGVLLMLLGWILANFLSKLIRRILSSKRFERISSGFNESNAIKQIDLDLSLASVLSKFVYWVVIILFLVMVSDNMGWSEVSQEIGDLFSYLPKLLIATIIFVIGMYVADVVRSLLKASLGSLSFGGGHFVSTTVYYIILIIISITALNQAGIETTVITANLSIIIGSVLLAFAIGFGLASKDVLRKILFSYYSGQTFEIGQVIKAGPTEGMIIAINNMSVLVQTSDGVEVIPADELMSSRTKIVRSAE